MTTIEQMAGRGCRSKDDYVSVYLLDEKTKELYESSPSLWSQNFRNQISWDENELLEDKIDEGQEYTEKDEDDVPF